MEIIYVDKNSEIPLYGIDFLGIVDRGTNIIELKPLTLCNLKCKYCFVKAGDYKTNFIIDLDYLIENVKKIIEKKGKYGIEVHIAPYGEILLYPKLPELIKKLWEIQGIEIISMQTNGLLLSESIINELNQVNLSRINISLNSLNKAKLNYLSGSKDFDIEGLIDNILYLLNTEIDLLIAPVWFPGENDEDIEEIIRFVIKLRNQGFSEKKLQIGIQKYLIYKTGRKLKKIRPKSWNYFYKQLTLLEKEYDLKLKLGPHDFNIHKRKIVMQLNLKRNDFIELKVISKSRWDNEFIGKINDNFGIKIILNKSIKNPEYLINRTIRAKIIKANYKNNILTASYSL